jgi:CRISPR/Cas system-associated endonuclease Cas1
VTEEGKQSLYWNIPIANTTFIMLGTGTSITQAATPTPEQQHYVIATLIRGGVFGEAEKVE